MSSLHRNHSKGWPIKVMVHLLLSNITLHYKITMAAMTVSVLLTSISYTGCQFYCINYFGLRSQKRIFKKIRYRIFTFVLAVAIMFPDWLIARHTNSFLWALTTTGALETFCSELNKSIICTLPVHKKILKFKRWNKTRLYYNLNIKKCSDVWI